MLEGNPFALYFNYNTHRCSKVPRKPWKYGKLSMDTYSARVTLNSSLFPWCLWLLEWWMRKSISKYFNTFCSWRFSYLNLQFNHDTLIHLFTHELNWEKDKKYQLSSLLNQCNSFFWKLILAHLAPTVYQALHWALGTVSRRHDTKSPCRVHGPQKEIKLCPNNHIQICQIAIATQWEISSRI